MKHNKKVFIFIISLVILVIGISAASAADIQTNQTTDTSQVQTTTQTTTNDIPVTTQETSSLTDTDNTVNSVTNEVSTDTSTKSVTKQVTTTNNNIINTNSKDSQISNEQNNVQTNTVKTSSKSLKTSDGSTNSNNFTSYFGSTGTTSNVTSGDTIYVNGSVNLNQNVVIDKSINLVGTNNAYNSRSDLIINNGISNTTLCSNSGEYILTDNGSNTTNVNSCSLCSNSNTLSSSILKTSSSKVVKSSLKGDQNTDYNGNVFTIVLNGEGSTTEQTTHAVVDDIHLNVTMGQRSYVKYILNGTFINWWLRIDNKNWITDVSVDATNATLINCAFRILRNNATMNITNAHIFLTPESKLKSVSSIIDFEGNSTNNILNNVTIDGILSYESIKFTLINMPATQNTVIGATGSNNKIINSVFNVTIEDAPDSITNVLNVINLAGANNSLINSTIDLTLPAYGINWETASVPPLTPLAIGSNAVIDNNNITYHVNQNLGSVADYATSEILLAGGNNTITNNNFHFTGDKYVYGFFFSSSSNNNISNNNFTVNGTQYANAIYIHSNCCNNTIANNNINITCGNLTYDITRTGNTAESVAYPIAIEDNAYTGGMYTEGKGNTVGNKIINNTVTGTGYSVYGVEQYGGDNSTIENNTIDITAHTAMGMAITGVNTLIQGNKISIIGETNETLQSADYFKPRTVGIYNQYGKNASVINNTITAINGPGITFSTSNIDSVAINNTVKTNNTYSVILDTVTDTNVTNNTLNAKELLGDASVQYDSSSNNIVKDNTASLTATNISVDPVTTDVKNTVTITAKLIDSSSNVLSGKTLNFTIGSTVVNEVTDANGIAKYTYTPTTAGTYDVKVTFEGDSTYSNSTNTTTVTVNKLNTVISASATSPVTIGEKTTISGTVKDSNNKALNTTVTITINNESPVTVTVTDGVFTYDYTTTTVGQNNVVITTPSTTNYNNDTFNTNFIVNKFNTIISASATSPVTVGDNTTISGTVKDSNNKALTTTVTITINNGVPVTIAVTDGVFTYNYTTTTVGQNNVVITTPSTTNYASSTFNTNFVVNSAKPLKLNTTINANVTSPVKVGETTIITGIITDSNNMKVNLPVTIVINDGTPVTLTTTNGIFTYNYTTTTAGINNVTITTANTTNYESTTVNTNFVVNKINTIITVDSVNTIVKDTNITFKLTDENNNAIANKTVTVSIANNTVNATTNNNGIAIVEITSTTNGLYNVIISFAGDNKYNKSTNTTTITIQKLNTTLTVNPINGVVQNTIYLQANVTDSQGNNVTGGNVVFKINGKTIRDANGNVIYANVTNGVAKVEYIIPRSLAKDNLTIEAKYSGIIDAYGQSNNTNTINVTKRTADFTLTVNKNPVKSADVITYMAIVRDSNGTLLNNGQVVFKFQGKTIRDANGNPILVNVTNGMAKLQYTIPNGISARGYNITAVYANKDYTRTESIAQLTAQKIRSTMTLNQLTTIRGSNTTLLTGIIKDINGNLMTGTHKISVKINGKNSGTYTVTNGTINTNITIPNNLKNPNYTISVKIGDNNGYYGTNATTTLLISNPKLLKEKVSI